MKRLVVTISLSLVVVLTLSFLYVSGVASAKPIQPSVQMVSTSYAGSSQAPGGAFTVTIPPFSVAVPAKLEVTSENTLVGNTEICQITLDGASLVSTPMDTPSNNADLTFTDTSVAAGSHTLAVTCTPFPSANVATHFSGSISAIITTGL